MTRTRIVAESESIAIEVEPKELLVAESHDDLQPGEVCSDIPLTMRVEALLIATDRPLTEARLAEALGIAGKGAAKRIVAAIEELNAEYERSGRSFRADRLAGGWQLLTVPALGAVLHRLHADRQQSRLSQPALETLAIISYRQPIMRAEIEAIRGVAAGEVLRGLLERRLVKIVGRAEELGRPMLYGTTKEFLKVFGLSSLEDLPQVKGLNPQGAKPASARAQSSNNADVEQRNANEGEEASDDRSES
jgi:segregation and condensation protein B